MQMRSHRAETMETAAGTAAGSAQMPVFYAIAFMPRKDRALRLWQLRRRARRPKHRAQPLDSPAERRMRRQEVVEKPFLVLAHPFAGIDDEKMSGARGSRLERRFGLGDFFQGAKQGPRIAGELDRRSIGQIFALARNRHRD